MARRHVGKIFVVAVVLDASSFFAGSILAKRCWSRPSWPFLRCRCARAKCGRRHELGHRRVVHDRLGVSHAGAGAWAGLVVAAGGVGQCALCADGCGFTASRLGQRRRSCPILHDLTSSSLLVFLSLIEVMLTTKLATDNRTDLARIIDRRCRILFPLVFVGASAAIFLR